MEIQGAGNPSQGNHSIRNNTPDFKLYSVKGIVIATFFGSALAGGYLIAKNYQRLGKQSYARWALFYAVLALITTVFLGEVLLESVPATMVSIPIFFAMWLAAKQLQGAAIEQHMQNQGQLESCWKAFGVSLLVAVVILLFIVFLAVILDANELLSL